MMMARDSSNFETDYQPLGSFYDDDGETPPAENIIHNVPENGKGMMMKLILA